MTRPHHPRRENTPPSTPRQVEGRLERKGRVGFILSENPELGDVRVEDASLRQAFDGDRVRANVISPAGAEKRIGHIIEVLERARAHLVGAFGRIQGHPVVICEAAGEPIPLTDLAGLTPGDGELVVCRMDQWPTSKEAGVAALVQVLGPRSAPGVELQALIHAHDLPNAFPREIEAEASAFGEEVPEEAWRGRETWFDRRVFTIDGADAKDFDDAVALEALPNGGWKLGVHIADVAHYVRANSLLDAEALRRGTSVYLSGTVLPMLPFPLSDGLCSLRPERIRLTLACEIELSSHGEVKTARVFESAIRSARRFTYEQVDQILKGQEIPGVSPEIHEDVRRMGRLATIVRKRRFARGSLDFDFPEAYVLNDPQGRPLDIRRRERLESHRLVEDFMLLANEAVARFMEKAPFLYRIHETPDPTKLGKLKQTIEAAGIHPPRNMDSGDPKILQRVLEMAHGKPAQALIHTSVLRSLKQAVYSPINKGHYGLASACYTHFTSPIRRYPDLIVHRIIKERLHDRLDGTRQNYWKSTLPKLATHTSQRERAAVTAEREYLDVQRVQFMQAHVGRTFRGVISGVTNFGFFVQLDAYFVEGLVHVSSLKGDYFMFDELRLTLRGKRSGRVFHMGQAVDVLLAAANSVKRQLDFEWVPSSQPAKISSVSHTPKSSSSSHRREKRRQRRRR